ncbi:hypothetical protein [Microbacterium sp. WCS2018Hpa-9]|uniref:hypothetical protein n=1 Tax=Microbacterium sp. WCS2018Hpa-9 TaxID=3073635 RepID=UPI002889A79A|nr:hypothetical protein [Microbacterium sp. WCS2018Hpa-9]
MRDFESPFNVHDPGFNRDWWSDPFFRSKRADYRPYSFVDEEGNEVARVLLRADAGFSDPEGAGVSLPLSAVAIDFIEVHAEWRWPRRGVGMHVVRLVEDLFPSRTLYAFSEEADSFWAATGWVHIPRLDDSAGYRPLFVLDRG